MIVGTSTLHLDPNILYNILKRYLSQKIDYPQVVSEAEEYWEHIYQSAKQFAGEDFDYIQDDCEEDDLNGIYWEVLETIDTLSFPISRDDVPEILRFLNTQPSETRESWEEWRGYWARKEAQTDWSY